MRHIFIQVKRRMIINNIIKLKKLKLILLYNIMRNISDPTQFRNNVINSLSNILNNKKNAVNLEKGIYNKTLDIADEKNIVKKWENAHFTQIYIDKLRTIYINLKNPTVLELITKQKIKPHELAFMTHQEIMPDKWKQLIDLTQNKPGNIPEGNMFTSSNWPPATF